ncbi:MAG: thioredoxin domain-containing protein [Alphaproteobacteria bacterium]|uniref:Thioredoxin domain-containing protein n=1 Tax=Candidatus Nitrobium versatile TaxID=2884831 RepID=A0A953LWK7_9BACT|nr:thioredoxin domain-containing protein [Candidatus Nitrobium versatile]
MRISGVYTTLQNRIWIFPGLALVTLVIGQICKTSCSFLSGDILGLDLNIFGVLFYSLLLVAVIAYKRLFPKDWVMSLIAATVSAGVGAEFILIKFQVEQGVYCPKCLISGLFLLLMFVMVVRHLKVWLVALLVLLGAVFTSLTFNGSVIPSYAKEVQHPSFGNEKARTEIVVYSDYFCPACRDVDGRINFMLRRLQDKARILFVDVPLHKESGPYAELFLYTWFASGNRLEDAIRAREIFFQASKAKTDPEGVKGFLRAQGIPFREDKSRAREIFRSFYNPLLKKDAIKATPTVVIVQGSERKAYEGGAAILKALEEVASSR